jgi:hypothetical protein
MKLYLLLMFICATSMWCLSQNETPRNVPSTIQHVVVYMSGALDRLNGKINYQIVLQPGETKKTTLAYSVKSPQNRAIRGSRNVRRSRTKF